MQILRADKVIQVCMARQCTNPGEYAGGPNQMPRRLDRPTGTCGNRLLTPGDSRTEEEVLYCKTCLDEMVRIGEIY